MCNTDNGNFLCITPSYTENMSSLTGTPLCPKNFKLELCTEIIKKVKEKLAQRQT